MVYQIIGSKYDQLFPSNKVFLYKEHFQANPWALLYVNFNPSMCVVKIEKKNLTFLCSLTLIYLISVLGFFFVTAAGDFTPTLSLSIPLSLPYPLAPELSDCSIFLLPLLNQIIQPVTCVLPNFKSDYHNSTSMPPFLLQQIFAIAAVKHVHFCLF